MTSRRQFTSDNRAGICPEALNAIQAANVGHAASYGDDEWTRKAADAIRTLFETDCDVYFVFNGTAANSLALATLCRSYQSVICHETSHVETDECGAPEFFGAGTKLLLASGNLGKISPSEVHRICTRRTDIHFPRPHALSISQATELETVYSVEEVRLVCAAAKAQGLRVHMDGARFANAVASLGCHPADITWRAGVDVLCFGGTKNGMPVGEAVVFFDRTLSGEFAFRCKQAGQLASKMRFLAAPWVGMLESGAWLKHASRANAMASLLARHLRSIPGIDILFPVEANSVFIQTTPSVLSALKQRGWEFYTFIGVGGARLMCSWDTTESDVEAVAADLREIVAGGVYAGSSPK